MPYRTHMLTTLVLLASAMSAMATGTRHDHSHDHAHHADHALQLDAGQRWQTDAALRDGMEQVRDALHEAHANASHAELPGAIDAAIEHMVRHCKLAPKADASLHVLLGRLSAAAVALEQEPHAAAALDEIGSVLELYPRYFEHPDWDGASHAH